MRMMRKGQMRGAEQVAFISRLFGVVA